MKLAVLMIVLPVFVLLMLATLGPRLNPDARPPRASAKTLASSPAPQTPDAMALERIKKEHASERFPFLVSSLCRDFLARYPASPHRAEIEAILKRNQEQIGEAESIDRERMREIIPRVEPPRDRNGGDIERDCAPAPQGVVKQEPKKPGKECLNRGFLASELISVAPGFRVSCSNFVFRSQTFALQGL